MYNNLFGYNRGFFMFEKNKLNKRKLKNEILKEYNDYIDDYYDYYDDYDYYNDYAYKYLFEYCNQKEIVDKFYKSLNLLSHILKPSAIKRIENLRNASIDTLDVYLDIKLEDFINNKENFILNTFEENNKYNLDIGLKLVYTNSCFNKISKISLILINPFLNLDEQKIRDFYSFNERYNKNRNLDFCTIDFLSKRIGKFNKYPEYCESNEEIFMYDFLKSSFDIKTINENEFILDNFNVKDIIKNNDVYNLFRLYNFG